MSRGLTGASKLELYLRGLRRRALLLLSGEAFVLGLSAAVAVLALLSATTGAVVTPLRSLLSLVLVLVGPALSLAYVVYRGRNMAGLGATRLLAGEHDALSKSLRGALELASSQHEGVSDQLLQAHVSGVAAQVEALPVAQLLPARSLRRPRLVLPLLLGLTCAAMLLQLPQLRSGLRSLATPARVRADGTLVANVVENISLRLLYPSYMQREPVLLANPAEFEAPAGTTVEVALVPRIPATSASLTLPQGNVRLSARAEAFSGRFVVRESGSLMIRLRAEGREYEHQGAIRMVAQADRVPVVELRRPTDNAAVDASVPLEVSFRAQDDEGLLAVDLVLQLPGGTEIRNRVWTPAGEGDTIDTLETTAALLPEQAGIYAGDQFELWVEAHDGDAVSGPHVGRSEPVTLFALSDAQQLSEQLPQLKAVLDLGVDSLAEHLEASNAPDEVQDKRMVARNKVSQTFTDALDSFVRGLSTEADRSRFEGGQLDAMADRVRRLLRPLQTAVARGSYFGAMRARLDRAMVEELEADVLFLADLLSQAHVQEAQAIADELQELRRRMQSLLADLSQANSEQAKRELLAELNRAEARLRELMRSMSQLASHVPSEFVNEEAIPESETGSTMQDLRKAVQAGDMEAAARHLEQLERELSSLTDNLNEGGLRFREARFGPRDKAMAEAQERLAMLKEEQRRLSQQSATKTRQVMGRGAGQTPANPQAMDELADKVSRQLGKVDPSVLGAGDQELYEQAQQRVKDTKDALNAGDLSEAARMSAAGSRTLDRLSRNLGVDAQMFPGHDGRTGKNAAAATEASKHMERLQQSVDDALPRVSDHLNRDDLNELQEQAAAQGKTRSAAEQLRDKFDHGPGGMPLSPDASRRLQEVEQAMHEAEQELRQGDPQAASLSQEEAAEQLESLQEELAQQQQMAQQGGRGQERGSGREQAGGKVEIPDDKDFKAPAELRRRLLDAMREASPPGYEAAVQRYFKELMR